MKSPDNLKLPPSSIETEESVLAGCLLSEDMLQEAAELLRPEDFYRTAHQKIFAAIMEMDEDGQPIDLVTVVEWLRGNGQLEAVGGASYIAKIIDSAPVPPNMKTHAEIVLEKANLRRTILVAQNAATKCFEAGKGGHEKILSGLQDSIIEIAEATEARRPNITSLKAAIDISIEKAQDAALSKDDPKSRIFTGFTRVDRMTGGFSAPDFGIIAARPGMGKTAWALAIAKYNAINGKPSGFFSLEMSKDQLATRLIAQESGINTLRFKDGQLTDIDWYNLTNAAGKLADLPIYIDDTPDLTPHMMLQRARTMKKRFGIRSVFVDYLQLMDCGRRDLDTEAAKIGYISKKMKGLAKKLEIPVFAISQLSRKVEERSDKHPVMSDLRSSGQLEQDADIIIFLYRDDYYNRETPLKGVVDVDIAKQRNGPTGMVNIQWLETSTGFSDG